MARTAIKGEARQLSLPRLERMQRELATMHSPDSWKHRSSENRIDIPVVEDSDNVFADLGLPDPEDLQMKAELARQMCKRITSLGLTQTQAANRLGLKQPDVSKLVYGRHTGFSADRLIRLIGLLNLLDVDVEIVLRPQRTKAGKRGTVSVLERTKRA